MSVTLGIYDIFANIIPGFLYLFVFNEMARAFGLPYLDLAQSATLPSLVLLTLSAYLVGIVMDTISYRFWYRVFYRVFSEYEAYNQFKERYSELDIQFRPEHTSLLFNIIRQRNYDLANDIEKNKVISIMLRNVSLALFLLSIPELYLTFNAGFHVPNLIFAIVALLGSIITINRANSLSAYFDKQIFENAAIYGKNINAILNVKSTPKKKKDSV